MRITVLSLQLFSDSKIVPEKKKKKKSFILKITLHAQ